MPSLHKSDKRSVRESVNTPHRKSCYLLFRFLEPPPPLAPPSCENNTKIPKFDGNNMECCSDRGAE